MTRRWKTRIGCTALLLTLVILAVWATLVRTGTLHERVGDFCWRTGNERGAARWWKRALKRQPDNADLHFMRGAALDEIGHSRLSGALLEFQAAARLNPDDAAPLVCQSNIHLGRREYDRAAELAAQAMSKDPDIGHATYARAMLGLGRYNEAISHFNQFLRRLPGAIEVHYDLGRAYEAAGRLEEAVEAYRVGLRLRDERCKRRLAALGQVTEPNAKRTQ